MPNPILSQPDFPLLMKRRRKSAIYYLTKEMKRAKSETALHNANKNRLIEGGLFTLITLCSHNQNDPRIVMRNVHFVGERLLAISKLKPNKDKGLTPTRLRAAKIVGTCLTSARVADDLLIVPVSAEPKWRPVTIMWVLRVTLGQARDLMKFVNGGDLPTNMELVSKAEDVAYHPDLRHGTIGA